MISKTGFIRYKHSSTKIRLSTYTSALLFGIRNMSVFCQGSECSICVICPGSKCASLVLIPKVSVVPIPMEVPVV